MTLSEVRDGRSQNLEVVATVTDLPTKVIFDLGNRPSRSGVHEPRLGQGGTVKPNFAA